MILQVLFNPSVAMGVSVQLPSTLKININWCPQAEKKALRGYCIWLNGIAAENCWHLKSWNVQRLQSADSLLAWAHNNGLYLPEYNQSYTVEINVIFLLTFVRFFLTFVNIFSYEAKSKHQRMFKKNWSSSISVGLSNTYKWKMAKSPNISNFLYSSLSLEPCIN